MENKKISFLKEKISELADGREIKIVAASKYANLNQIRETFKAGINTFGENRVRDLLKKQQELGDTLIKWHLIGHLQTNKVKKVIGKVDLIHSVDSVRLAVEINKRALERRINQKVLIQVNVSKEESKYGFEPKEGLQVAKEIAKLEAVELSGLMTIAPYTNQNYLIEEHFEKSRSLFEEIKQALGHSFTWLSMGMSNDFEIAIKYGSNMLRLGSLIFE